MRFTTFAVILLVSIGFSAGAEAGFFADPRVQAEAPAAFALQPEAGQFIRGSERAFLPQREALVRAIWSDAALVSALGRWTELTIQEQIPHLRKVFELECKTLGIKPPELVFDENLQGPAFFDFDPEKPSPGRVILNPLELAKMKDKWGALLLLIHETRHSAQFQLANSGSRSVFAYGFLAAFRAQKALSSRLGYCDFMTLLNEYEAFQYANYVVGRLTGWKVDTLEMGSFASQYDGHGHLKIDLSRLSREVGPARLIETFNELEKVQYDRLRGN